MAKAIPLTTTGATHTESPRLGVADKVLPLTARRGSGFPPHPPTLNETSRRRFLFRLLAASQGLLVALSGLPLAGAVLSPLLRRSRRAEPLSLGSVRDLSGQGPRAVRVRVKQQDGYAERTRTLLLYAWSHEGSIRVLSGVCTHLGCNVRWDGEEDRFTCPCHGGAYDRAGRVLAGPPPRPLRELPVRIVDGEVLVSLEKGGQP